MNLENILKYTVLSILGLAVALLIMVVDTELAPSNTRAGMTTGAVEFSPAHTTFMVTMAGKVTVTTPVHHPDRWYAYVNVRGEIFKCEVSQSQYAEYNGLQLPTTAAIKRGRLSSAYDCEVK